MKIIKFISVEGDLSINMHLDAGFQLYGNPVLKYNGGSTNTLIQAMVLYAPEEKIVEPKSVKKDIK